MMKTIPKWVRDIVQMAVIFAVVFYGNRGLQTYLGQRSVDNLSLQSWSYEQALVEAKKKDRLIVAEFSAVWCGSCRKFHDQVLGNDSVKTLLDDNFVFTRLEYESDDQPYFAQYAVTGFPTILLLDTNGQAITRLPLTFDPSQFASVLASL